MGERLLCKQEVIGSIPFTSTNLRCGAAEVVRRSSSSKGGPKRGSAASVGKPLFRSLDGLKEFRGASRAARAGGRSADRSFSS